MMKIYPADILLPDFSAVDGKKWACVACDQYTSEPEYWERVAKNVKDSPSTLNLMLPEVWLGESDMRVPPIQAAMKKYLNDGVLVEHKSSAVYLERIQSDGKLRRGLVCAIDLDDYDFSVGSVSPVRPTEKTVVERIPPRLAVRRGAPLEMPHVMLLVDDPEDLILSRFAGREMNAYSFDLAEGGGSVSAAFVSADEFDELNASLAVLADNAVKRAEKNGGAPITIAVGDGNHSLATAKASWQEVRATLTEEEAKTHPARYALVEICNLHEESLVFEPIYRLIENVDVMELANDFEAFAASQNGRFPAQTFDMILEGNNVEVVIEHPEYTLPVASLQHFLDEWLKSHPRALIDYIHGEDTLCRLAAREACAGFVFEGMSKSDLFPAVEADGTLPRKTFSMGHAADKRYYIECRRILK
ncbi:MAG: DUF1015 domain-containing protein [Clostridia bacterium]|nr:DUF1015 domain-containing protein [Clostridia bacterium]